MTNINGVSHYNYNKEDVKTNYEQNDIKLEDISILYTTEKKEEDRTTFEETFNNVYVNDSGQGQKFLGGLIDNKENLMKELGLTEEQYDSLACTALALASQETGMGQEAGYNEENKGLGGAMRKFAKWADTTFFGGGSASSGLTQMKIYDFINDPTKLSEEQKEILEEYGITADGVATNNLYDNPDKAAVATMVVLKSITEKYDDYKNILSNNHSDLETKLNLTSQEDKDNALNKGNEILSKISSIYSNMDNDTKVKIRTELKDCFIALDDTKVGDKVDKNGKKVTDDINEEIQLNELNKMLGDEFKLESSDLYYIRYALTDENAEMNMTEFCAFGWNKGTNDNSLKLDRLLADKIGTILSNPEDFDYDQFTVNVATLALMYAGQSVEKEMLL